MKTNMGSTDRVIRVILALVIGVLYFTKILTGILGIILLVLGVIFLLTSLMSWCPLYVPMGFSTKKTK